MALSMEQYKDLFRNLQGMKEVLMERLDMQRESSMGVLIEIGDRICEQLIIEILSWLPVKDLLQFKSVCKLWYSIIGSPHFVTKHLRNYYDDNNNWRDCLIIQHAIGHASELVAHELLVDVDDDDDSMEVLAYQQIDTPTYNSYMCGPCDGLYFLWGYSIYSFPGLWNPTLNEYERLPDLISKPNLPSYLIRSYVAYGFGFDSKTKDYKVVAIHGYLDKRTENLGICDYPKSVFIYSLKSNSWRYWGDLKHSYYLLRNGTYVFVNGCYYWLGCLEYCGCDYVEVLSFDITREACEYVPLPNIEKKPRCECQLVVYRDSISLVYVPYKETNISIWAWNEGVWTQKLNMEVGFEVWGAF